MKNNIGCALFIDEKNGINGIAYSPKTDFIKLESFSNLDKDVIWITNISTDIIKDFKNIKGNNFLGIKLESLIYQMGISNIPRNMVAKELYTIIKNTIDILLEKYEIKFNQPTLILSLVEKFGLDKTKIKDDQNIREIIKTNNNFEITNVQKSKNEEQMYLFYPRYEYNRNLCKISTPVGIWKELKSSAFREKSNNWFLDLSNKYHFIAYVKFTNVNKDLKYLLPSNYLNSRVWINDLEFKLFSKFTNIFVDKFYVCSSKMHLQDIENKKLFKLNSFEKGSISNGIASLNYVRSFTSANPQSLLTYWINSYDKCKMLEIAIIFSKFNIKVISYGSGGILISFENNIKNKELILKICQKLNIIYPMILFN